MLTVAHMVKSTLGRMRHQRHMDLSGAFTHTFARKDQMNHEIGPMYHILLYSDQVYAFGG